MKFDKLSAEEKIGKVWRKKVTEMRKLDELLKRTHAPPVLKKSWKASISIKTIKKTSKKNI